MTRVIKDSDDEGSSSPLRLDEDDYKRFSSRNSQQKAVFAAKSTTSEETLDRELQKAREQLLGETLSISRLKSTPAGAQTSDDTNVARPQSHQTSVDVQISFGLSTPSGGEKWDLPASVRAEFAQNEPSMFADTSSTVPDNTFDQQRLIEAALTDGESMPPPNVPVKDSSSSTGSSSFPWSAYLATQNKSETSEHSPQQITAPRGSSALSTALQAGGPAINLNMEPSCTPPGDPDLHSILAALNAPMPAVKSEQAHVEDPSVASGVPSSTNKGRRAVVSEPRSSRARNVPLEPAASSNASTKRQKEVDDLARSDELAIGLPKEQYQPRPSRSRSAQTPIEPIDYSVAPEKAAKNKLKRARTSDSPLNVPESPPSKKIKAMDDMGFTPNRSREALTTSGGNLEEAIDGLLHEPSQKTKPKEMASESEQHAAKETASGNNAKAADNVQIEARSSSARTSARRQTRHALVAIEIPQMTPPDIRDHGGHHTTSETYVIAQEGLASKIQSVDVVEQVEVRGPKASPKDGRKRKRSARGEEDPAISTAEAPFTEAAASHEETPEAAAPEDVPPPIKEKKRGRGRPRKATKVITEEEELEVIALVGPQQIEQEAAEQARLQPLQELDVNAKMSSGADEVDDTAAGQEQAKTPDEDEKELQSQVPQAENGPTTKKSSITNERTLSQSPAMKGQSNYRVGLSRRARIAPLLKVVKK